MIPEKDKSVDNKVAAGTKFGHGAVLPLLGFLTVAIGVMLWYSATNKQNNSSSLADDTKSTVSVSQEEFDRSLGRELADDQQLKRRALKDSYDELKREAKGSIDGSKKTINNVIKARKSRKDPVAALEEKLYLAEIKRVHDATRSDFPDSVDLSNLAIPSIEPDSSTYNGGRLDSIPSFPEGFAGSIATKFVEAPNGTLTVPSATVLSAVLQQEINSDYPGTWIGIIERDIYDRKKEHIIFPTGSKVIGEAIGITNPNEAISFRIAMPVKEIIRPDGLRVDMSKAGINMQDSFGVGAIGGNTNNHLLPKLLATVAYAGLVGFSTDLGFRFATDTNNDRADDAANRPTTTTTTSTSNNTSTVDTTSTPSDPVSDDNGDGEEGNTPDSSSTTSNNSGSTSVVVTTSGGGNRLSFSTRGDDRKSVDEVVAENLSKGLVDALKPVLDKYLSLVPTAIIPPGTHLKITLTEDIYANPWKSVYANYTR